VRARGEGARLAAGGLIRYGDVAEAQIMTSMPEIAPSNRVPVLESVREGFAFVAREWRAILPLAVIGGVAVGGVQIFTDMARARQDMGAATLGMIGAIVVQVVLVAAFLRRALSHGEAPLALRAGRDEANLLGTAFSLGFLYVIIAIFALLFTSMCLAALAAGSDIDLGALQTLAPEEAARRFAEALGADGLAVLLLLVIAFLALFVWIAARVVLAYPATIAEGRMIVFSSWGWTKGSGLRISTALVLLFLGGVFLGTVALAPFGVALDLAFGKGAQLNPSSPAHWILSLLGGLANTMFSTAPYAGMTAFLYRGLRPAAG
jgi:hypothetical protein